jgi:hypothetical protein
VLGEYKNRYQRSKQEAEEVLRKEEDRQAFYGNFPIHEQSSDAAADYSDRFQNPFERGAPKNKK